MGALCTVEVFYLLKGLDSELSLIGKRCVRVLHRTYPLAPERHNVVGFYRKKNVINFNQGQIKEHV